MNISYDSYRVFYYAAKHKSFSQAAAALYKGQPNVTRTIHRLETQLSCPLFSRSPQGVKLTPEGERLYSHIAAAFEQIEAGEDELRASQSLQSGAVHIAASGLALECCLLRVLSQYRRAYPHVQVCLKSQSTPGSLAAVHSGLADLCLTTGIAQIPDSLVRQPLVSVEEIPVCGPAFAKLFKGKVTLRQLSGYPIIGLTEGTASRTFYASVFAGRGASFSPEIEVAAASQILPAVQSGLGIGFVPRQMLHSVPAGAVCPITLDDPIPRRSICLSRRKHQPLSLAAKHLCQMLLEDAARTPALPHPS